MPRTPFSLRSPTYPKCHSFTIKSSLIKILHSSTHVLFLSFITKKSNSIHLDFLLCQNFGFFHFEKFCYTESMSLAQRPHGCIRHHFCIPTHIWMGFFALYHAFMNLYLPLNTYLAFSEATHAVCTTGKAFLMFLIMNYACRILSNVTSEWGGTILGFCVMATKLYIVPYTWYDIRFQNIGVSCAVPL